MAIKGPNADPGLIDDLSHGSIHSRSREYLDGRLEKRVDVALCVYA